MQRRKKNASKGNEWLTATEICSLWGYKARTTAVRILDRFGIGGIKLGANRQSGRRYAAKDVERVTELAKGMVRGGRHGTK